MAANFWLSIAVIQIIMCPIPAIIIQGYIIIMTAFVSNGNVSSPENVPKITTPGDVGII